SRRQVGAAASHRHPAPSRASRQDGGPPSGPACLAAWNPMSAEGGRRNHPSQGAASEAVRRMSDELKQIGEQLLVLRCQAGDHEAFAGLVQRYGPRLGYFLRKLLRRREGVDDLVQEVWLDVFRGL